MAVTVETIRRAVLQPSPASDGAGGKKVPLTIFDRASTDGHIPAVFAWFAADEHGRKCFHLNDAGVLVVEATADADLAHALAQDVSTHINQLYPKADKERVDEPIFQVQLTRYQCGGLVIGTATHHQAADGQSMSVFYTAWATTVKTDLAVLPSPFTDRSATDVPRSSPPAAPMFDHRNIEFKGEHSLSHSYRVLPMNRIKNLAVHFPDEFVAGLKARAGTRCTTFQCLLAHAWKKVTAARDLASDDFTQVRVAVNCRGRVRPTMPTDFFGNMVLWAFPRMQVQDLLSATYPAVVGVIRDAVSRVDDEYIQSFIDFGEAEREGGEELASAAATPGMVFSPDLEVDSWLGFRFHDLDFGCGPPCAFLPPDIPIEGVMIFVPSCGAKGGVDLFLTLDDEHVDAFEEICYSMD
ncbi:unnamed protein product [Alopecurus aequalis]